MRYSIIILLCSLLTVAKIEAQQNPSSVSPSSKGADDPAVCKLNTLPPEIQATLNEEFKLFKIVGPSDLSTYARGRWESEVPRECPGFATGKFEGGADLIYVFLLIPVGPGKPGYRVVLFHHHTAPEKFDEKILEQSDEGIGRNLFVKRVPIDKFFDKPSQLKFNVASKDGILLVDAGEKEYEADIYYWSNGKYRHDPVDY